MAEPEFHIQCPWPVELAWWPVACGERDDSGDVPILVTGAVLPPVLLHRVEPQYTESARHVRFQGMAIVRAVIDKAGRVVDVKIRKPLPLGLNKMAVDAVFRWRFQPATLYGRPVKTCYSLPVVFRLHGNVGAP